ncbi:hypothetical protein SDC9_177642 [bioreactor metagenome]|uniref:Pyruvate:ferredoxin oxidoreductase core domain-containing protein n=1 Tax=bioreactor metagenome TaxID=1076179 RepID=A0A645H1H5_9ZZZZ
MEPVEFKKPAPRNLPAKDWALTGNKGKKHSIDNVEFDQYIFEKEVVGGLFDKYAKIEENEKKYEDYMMDDAEYAFVAYGTASRICKNAIAELRAQGYKIGLIRPQTLWPFPDEAFENRPNIKKFIDIEFSMGQMVKDVQLACGDKNKVKFHGRCGGVIIGTDEVVDFAKSVMGGAK